ncbi:MAG TPA: acyl-ACP--UDP-N-acetylglucosamine O-acyltransferase [Gammaproteobacteria bacterium]|nr:acyl-ACP--UDP-N-acetylglucosamine O-acyltransferase [Gammaproteobacteria bacterium]
MIDRTALIDESARVGRDVTVGPYSIIGPGVELGDGSWIGSHVVIRGPTRIGRENRIFHFASVGEDPQDKKYGGERTSLEIGDRNTIREYCTINRGTVQDQRVTRIGSDNWIMAYVHIAHDCQVGNDVIMANCATLAGHVHVHDHAILAGFSMIHQFCHIGSYAFCGMGCGVNRDVPPYVTVASNPARARGINAEGLRRRGFTRAQIQNVRRAYRLLYRQGLRLENARERLREFARESPETRILVDFLDRSERGITR